MDNEDFMWWWTEDQKQLYTELSEFVDQHLEELYHLVTHGGYTEVYPDIFGPGPGSALSDLMDNARGGLFEDVPSQYPEDAWYTYYDGGCEYAYCQDQEYLHWAQYSLLGFNIDRAGDIKSRSQLEFPDPDHGTGRARDC